MTLTSMHTHTEFCDGRGTVEDFCRAAFEKGFASIGFSAHAPVERAGLRTDWHLPEKRLDGYLDALRAARKTWAGKLDVFFGMEVDYIAGRMGPADPCYRDMGLDFVIGSVHYVPDPKGGDPRAVDGSAEDFAGLLQENYGGNIQALAAAYWRTLGEMIRAGGFDILGHIDLLKKNNGGGRFFSPESEMYRSLWRPCVDALGQDRTARQPAVELNTGGMIRGRIAEPYPSQEILAALVQAGVPVLVTADAHEPAHLGGHYGTALAALAAAGCQSLRVFTGRENGAALWRTETLEA